MTGPTQSGEVLPPGSLFAGKYRIVRELGRGGFGMVYLAHQENMGRDVAIKVLRGGATQMHHSAKERFLREVKIISRLRHPNTVTIHDFGETAGGILYMVLEYIEGLTVKQILRDQGAQPPRRALALTTQIARSLAEAHRHGVIHRDLKPANIMVTNLETETDFVKVLDFGIARLLASDQRDLTSIGLPEGERELIGTPRYMSPEQVRGESLSPASDVYSVGLILYEMLVGQPAVQGDTSLALISQQISPEPLRLDGLRALAPELAGLIRQATAKRLVDRFPDAETFADHIDRALLAFGGALPGSAAAHQTGRFAAANPSGSFSVTPSGNLSSSYLGRFPTGDTRETAEFDPQTPDPGFQARAPLGGAPPAVYGQMPLAAQAQHGASWPPYQSGSSGAPMPDHPTYPAHTALRLDPDGKPVRPDAAFSPQDGAAATNQPFTQKIYDFAQGEAGIDPNLPPPPSDENPFAIPDPSASRDDRLRPDGAQEGTSAAGFAFEFVRLVLFGLLALIGLYLAFILVAPIFGQFLSGTMKFVATVILATAIPLLTALGENSKRERFEVIEKPYDRLVRVFVGTAIFSFGTAVLCSLVMSGAVVYDLRKFPNWFMSDAQRQSTIGEYNAQLSANVAQIVEDSTRALGMYEGKADDSAKVVTPVRVDPPAPTRPARQQPRKSVSEASGDTPQKPVDRTGTPATNSPSKSRSQETVVDGEKQDYIRW